MDDEATLVANMQADADIVYRMERELEKARTKANDSWYALQAYRQRAYKNDI